jgi:catechol 2,3-dioxygenase-like lactoylglutathione lyase family enzyme
MEFHRGRLLDHIHLRTTKLAEAKLFYKAVFDFLGIPSQETEDHLAADEFWLDAGETPSHIHLAFQAPDRDTVDRFHAAALAAGGRDNGKPGERDYHPGYYACFVLDPDGNNIEAVHHGPAKRSSPSVVFSL